MITPWPPVITATRRNKIDESVNVLRMREDGHTVVNPPVQLVYGLWQRDFVMGPALPAPDATSETIIN
jgi:hypothetical protein